MAAPVLAANGNGGMVLWWRRRRHSNGGNGGTYGEAEARGAENWRCWRFAREMRYGQNEAPNRYALPLEFEGEGRADRVTY